MLTRIITSIAALVVFFAVIFAGVIPLQIAIGAVILVMLYEVYGAVTKSRGLKTAGYISALILMVGIYYEMRGGGNVLNITIPLVLMLFMVFMIFLHGKIHYREVFSVAVMTVYVVLFMSFIPQLRMEKGLGCMGLIFVIAWGSDTSAYFCGTFLGKHKLIPHVSPKKTIEGSAGAVICTALLCVLYCFIWSAAFGASEAAHRSYMMFAVLGALGSAVSQLGDLAASAIKRDSQIKDYGKIFPGHGGFMDRFDSVLFITPLVYFFTITLL